MKKVFLIILFYTLFNYAYAQQSKVDSLRNVLSETEADTSKLKLVVSISWELMYSDLDSALIFAELHRPLIKSVSPKLRSKYFEILGVIHAQKYNLDSSLYYFRQCVKYDSLSENFKYLIDDYSNIANVYNISGQNDSALYFFNLSDSLIQIYPEIVSNKKKGAIYYNKALALKNKSDYINSIKYSIKAEKEFKRIDDKYGQFLCLLHNARVWGTQKQISKALKCLTDINDLGFPKSNGQKGDFYKLKGNLYVDADSLLKAKQYFSKSIDAYNQQNNNKDAFLVYGNMIDLYKPTDRINPNIIKKIKELYRKIDHTKFIKYTYYNYLEKLEMLNNNFYEALQYNDSALLYFNNNLDKLFEYKNRGLILEKLGKYKEAYPFIKQALSLKDSVFSMQIKEKINELSIQYETQKKEQKIKLQEKQNQIQKAEIEKQKAIIWMIVSFAVIFLIALIAFIVYRNQKQKQEILRLKIEAQENIKKEIAGELHSGVGSELTATILQLENKLGESPEVENIKNIYRHIRTASHLLSLPDFVLSTIEDEINNMVTNFKTDSLEIETGIYSKKGWNDIPPFIQQNIYRIVQELFTNSFKHADASNISMQLIRHDDYINLMYEDDGKGYNPDEIKSSHGYKNEIIGRTQVLKGTLSDESKKGVGTILNFKFPV